MNSHLPLLRIQKTKKKKREREYKEKNPRTSGLIVENSVIIRVAQLYIFNYLQFWHKCVIYTLY